MRRYLICLLLTVISWRAQSAEQDEAGRAAGPTGVACVPACNELGPALALAKRGWLVLGIDRDMSQVDALKKGAREAGLLGRTPHAQQGSPERIPFADNYVDLLVLNGTAEAELAAAARAEIMRVLTPIHGRAVLAELIGICFLRRQPPRWGLSTESTKRLKPRTDPFCSALL